MKFVEKSKLYPGLLFTELEICDAVNQTVKTQH